MAEYPATSLAKNKGKFYVLLTIPVELRQHFNGRKQLKRSTGTSDLAVARQRQHKIAVELYAQLDACKPDPRDVISNHLGWIGDAEEIQRMDDNGHLEELIIYHKNLEYGDDDGAGDEAVDAVNDGGVKAHEAYRAWKASQAHGPVTGGGVRFAVAANEYLASNPYGPFKTMRDCELSLGQFREFAGDIALAAVTPVLVHQFAEHIGQDKARETVSKKVGYVKRLFDHAVRKGWVQSNVFLTVKLDPKVGRERESYQPFTDAELRALFAQEIPDHLRAILAILMTTGMRLDEAALLEWEDVREDREDGLVYFDLTGSIVKNKGSKRRVPVHSKLDWVCAGKTGQMFPQFKRDADGKAQAEASKKLMPLVRAVTEHPMKVVHSLRGNFKDMLRDAGVSKEVNDFITGHRAGDVAGTYGSGPSMEMRAEAVERVPFDFL